MKRSYIVAPSKHMQLLVLAFMAALVAGSSANISKGDTNSTDSECVNCNTSQQQPNSTAGGSWEDALLNATERWELALYHLRRGAFVSSINELEQVRPHHMNMSMWTITFLTHVLRISRCVASGKREPKQPSCEHDCYYSRVSWKRQLRCVKCWACRLLFYCDAGGTLANQKRKYQAPKYPMQAAKVLPKKSAKGSAMRTRIREAQALQKVPGEAWRHAGGPGMQWCAGRGTQVCRSLCVEVQA